MRIYLLIFFAIFCFLLSCESKEKQNDNLTLEYTKNDDELILMFENNTSKAIVFPIPNTLHFGDLKKNRFNSVPELDGFPPITVYAIIEPNQDSRLYQKKLDSIVYANLSERGMPDVVNQMMPGDGDSILYLENNEIVKVKYKLIIKPLPNLSYASKYKQNYYPYEKVLKGNYPEGEYLRRFSKLNFGRAKFVLQPIIEDSLFINISEKDTE